MSLVALSYHYTDNDPLNKVDPLGLRPSENESDSPFHGNEDALDTECNSMFRDEMGGPAADQIGRVSCSEIVEALITGCSIRGGNHYTYDYDGDWRTGCQELTTTCDWRCDVNNVAGGALQGNPMYWIADGVDGLFGKELDLAANQGVDPYSGWFRIGFFASLTVSIVAAPGAGTVAATVSSSGALRLGAGCLAGAGAALLIDPIVKPDIDEHIDPWRHAGAECLVGAVVFFVGGR